MFVSSDSTSSHEFACQFGLAFFLYAKNTQNLGGNRAASASVYFNGQRPAIVTSGAGRHGWLARTDPSDSDTAVCVWGVCVHAFARVHAHSCACVSSCVRARCVCNIR